MSAHACPHTLNECQVRQPRRVIEPSWAASPTQLVTWAL